MTDKEPSQTAGMPAAYRSMRRISRGSTAQDVDNIFDLRADETVAGSPAVPDVAHVEAKTRDFGKVRALLSPRDCPAKLSDALRAKVRNVSDFCGKPYLFQAGYDAGEDVLMICFLDADAQNHTRIQGAIADALMASGYEDHAVGILFLSSDAPAAAQITRLAEDLLAQP